MVAATSLIHRSTHKEKRQLRGFIILSLTFVYTRSILTGVNKRRTFKSEKQDRCFIRYADDGSVFVVGFRRNLRGDPMSNFDDFIKDVRKHTEELARADELTRKVLTQGIEAMTDEDIEDAKRIIQQNHDRSIYE